jgi:hypothetical protein
VEEEVEAALEKEHKQRKPVLFPIRLDDAVMDTDQAWAASLRHTRHIGDFCNWKEPRFLQGGLRAIAKRLERRRQAQRQVTSRQRVPAQP